jgi:hypothetical protein
MHDDRHCTMRASADQVKSKHAWRESAGADVYSLAGLIIGDLVAA